MDARPTDAQQALASLARDWPPEARQELISPPVDEDAREPDPLRTIAELRRAHPQWSPEFAAAVATQRELIARGRSRGVIPPGPWLATRVGLEQSTRLAVARRRAHHLAAAGVASVVDLTAGLGVDSWACVDRGLHVVAIERDPLTAELCRTNVPGAHVQHADATEVAVDFAADLPNPVCWLVDPSRRSASLRPDGSRAGPERDPERWSPPWSFVEHLRDTREWVAAKAPGGFRPGPGWSAEWVGVANYVAECAVYSLPNPALVHPRQATLLGAGVDASDLTHAVGDVGAPVGAVCEYLGEPHPVFHRALASLCGDRARQVSADSTWITSDAPTIRGVRWLRIIGTAPLKRMGALARAHGVEAVAVKSRESPTSLSAIRSKVGLPDGNEFAVVIAHGLPDAILAQFVPAD